VQVTFFTRMLAPQVILPVSRRSVGNTRCNVSPL